MGGDAVIEQDLGVPDEPLEPKLGDELDMAKAVSATDINELLHEQAVLMNHIVVNSGPVFVDHLTALEGKLALASVSLGGVLTTAEQTHLRMCVAFMAKAAFIEVWRKVHREQKSARKRGRKKGGR